MQDMAATLPNPGGPEQAGISARAVLRTQHSGEVYQPAPYFCLILTRSAVISSNGSAIFRACLHALTADRSTTELRWNFTCENANHRIMGTAVKLRVTDCITDGMRPSMPQPTKWAGIGSQIDAAMIFARANFVIVHCLVR
jgi:hypothetical protein